MWSPPQWEWKIDDSLVIYYCYRRHQSSVPLPKHKRPRLEELIKKMLHFEMSASRSSSEVDLVVDFVDP